MSVVVAEQELYRACQIIFGPELDVSREFLEYLQWPGIKTAYRKRAMETHPDRVASQGEQARRHHTDLFLSIQEAYENLTVYLKARDRGYRLPATPRPARPGRAVRPQPAARKAESRTASTSTDRTRNRAARPGTGKGARHHQGGRRWSTEQLYQGPIPARKLLFGHYLYYAGIATWRTIIQALIWQRNGRPRLGEIARRFGLLTKEDIRLVLSCRTILQPFGDSAVRLGLLSERQINMLIFHQKCLQKKFGEFFVEKKILQPEKLARLLKEHEEHNAPFIAAASRARFN